MTSIATLKRRLEAIRPLVANPENTFLTTGWQDQIEALADIDATLAALALDRPEGAKRARLLLGRRGPLVRLSEANGWIDAFRNATATRGTSLQQQPMPQFAE